MAGELLFGKLISGGSVVVGTKPSVTSSPALKIGPIENFTFDYKAKKVNAKKSARKKSPATAKRITPKDQRTQKD